MSMGTSDAFLRSSTSAFVSFTNTVDSALSAPLLPSDVVMRDRMSRTSASPATDGATAAASSSRRSCVSRLRRRLSCSCCFFAFWLCGRQSSL
jgi:hypothetical protein